MLGNILKKIRKLRPYDVIICGDTISAYIAAYAAHLNGLKLLWLNSHISSQSDGQAVNHQATFSTQQALAHQQVPHQKVPHQKIASQQAPFDSLSPEGLNFLQHILSKSDIQHITQGVFDGVYREEGFQAFDRILGRGIHIHSLDLKKLILSKLQNKVLILPIEAVEKRSFNTHIEIVSRCGKTFPSYWAIDAQGYHSQISDQKTQLLSDQLWISRSITGYFPHKKNSVRFHHTEEGWRWQAYDKHGYLCETHWQKQPESHENAQQFNSQWYHRKKVIEGRCLLTVPTCFRLDPASGLGISLQIKSAMLAIRCIVNSIQTPDEINIHARQYQRHITSSFQELTQSLIPFYQQFGIDFNYEILGYEHVNHDTLEQEPVTGLLAKNDLAY